jgi:hypothetical protein
VDAIILLMSWWAPRYAYSDWPGQANSAWYTRSTALTPYSNAHPRYSWGQAPALTWANYNGGNIRSSLRRVDYDRSHRPLSRWY